MRLVKIIRELTIFEKICCFLLLLCLFINTVIIVDLVLNPDEVPSFFGYKSFIVMTEEMSPSIDKMDLVIFKETEENLSKGDIIAFQNDEDIIIVSRIESQTQDSLVTEFDNSKHQIEVLKSSVEGKYLFTVPYLGLVFLCIQEPLGFVTLVAILIGLYFMMM